MGMKRIRKGDTVIVLAGKDKGRQGEVLRMLDDEGKVVVSNVNMVKRHVKGNPRRGVGGSILEKEMPLHVSNVALRNPQSGKPDRIGFKTLGDGKKVRFFKSDGEVLDK